MNTIQTALFVISDWGDIIVPGVVFLLAAAVYLQRKNISLRHWSRVLSLVMLIYYPLYALIETVSQRELWLSSGDIVTRTLATSPIPEAVKGITLWYNLPFMHTNIGYTVFYSWGHFWLPAVLTVLAAIVFWLILKILNKYQNRFFEDGEVELGALTALLVGWPGFVIFLPLVFISIVLVSIFRLIFFKEAYTTMGYPMLFAVLLFLLYGWQFISKTSFIFLKA